MTLGICDYMLKNTMLCVLWKHIEIYNTKNELQLHKIKKNNLGV